MSLRDIRQKEWSESFLNSNKKGILYICPRGGKIYTCINIFEKLSPDSSILIIYPNEDIKLSWETDFLKRNYQNKNITYTTFASLKKFKDAKFDIIVIDEAHGLSEAALQIASNLVKNNDIVIGLTGTLNKYSQADLESIGLPIIVKYSIQQAIKEGVITDYEITIIETSLDNTVKQKFGKNLRTEKEQFKALSFVINKLQDEGKDTFFLRLNRMRIIQNSTGKLNTTKLLLKQLENERILVFCGNTKVTDSLGIQSYHSKSKEKDILERFQNGKINQLAICKFLNTGVTLQNLNKVLINYSDSNAENLTQKILRCMANEFSNPNKKAQIYIISTNEPVEQKWLISGLSFFDKEKIKTIIL